MEVSYLVFRITFALTMAYAHGLPKLINYSSLVDRFPDPIGWGSQVSLTLAMGAELFAALFVAFGLFTRLMSIPLIITMVVAFFIHHAADPFAQRELAFLFMMGFVGTFIGGSGHYSLQNFFRLSAGKFSWWLR